MSLTVVGVIPAVAACAPRTQSSLGPTPAEAGPETTALTADCSYSRRIEFPVLANAQFLSSFGVPREGGERWHAGVDISAPQMTPVVAAKDGVVTTLRNEPSDCCWVAVTHDDGWVSMYVHLTNDQPGTDDGMWIGIRHDLKEGDRVIAGEVLGWVGDSGNAEAGESHLHFELRTPGGEAIDPFGSLRRAFGLSPSAFLDPTGDSVSADGVITTGRPIFTGAFVDDDDVSGSAPVFEKMLSLGASVWCDSWGIRVCPEQPGDGTSARDWIRALSQSVDPIRVEFQRGVPHLDERGLQQYCGTALLCEMTPVTWDQVAALLVSAQSGESVDPAASFESMGHLLGVCGAKVDRGVTPTRFELAGTLLRWFGHTAPVPCGSVA